MTKKNHIDMISYSSLIEGVLPKMLEIGIPLNEGRVYLALLLEPSIPASRLCEITGIPDSKIYSILESATKLNMVEVQYGLPKTYRATAPAPLIMQVKSALKSRYENGIRVGESVEAQLQEVWTNVNKNAANENGLEIAYVVKGVVNIVSKMKEMIFVARRDVMIILPSLNLFASIHEQLVEAKSRGVHIRIAMPQKDLTKISSDTNAFDISILSQQCCDTWLLVADGRLLTVSKGALEHETSAILTKDRVLVQMSEAYFENPSCCFRAL